LLRQVERNNKYRHKNRSEDAREPASDPARQTDEVRAATPRAASGCERAAPRPATMAEDSHSQVAANSALGVSVRPLLLLELEY